VINLNNVNSRLNILQAKNIFGKLIRLPLALIPKSLIIPILQGPAKGLKWISGCYNHGCWLGIYEFEKQIIVAKTVADNDVILELGAHVGYFTIMFSRLVGPKGKVYAFEPIKNNINYIKSHLKLNDINNVKIFEYGAWIKTENLNFDNDTHNAKGRISSSGNNQINVVDINEFILNQISGKINLIKMDIEGSERCVFPHLLNYVIKNKTKLIISTHGDDITNEIVNLCNENLLKCEGLQWSNRPVKQSLTNSTLLYIYHE
jgi:FkbM family methyltransferase